jgi:hypothetical protein
MALSKLGQERLDVLPGHLGCFIGHAMGGEEVHHLADRHQILVAGEWAALLGPQRSVEGV